MPEKIGSESDDLRPIPMYHTILEMGDDAESDEQCFMEKLSLSILTKSHNHAQLCRGGSRGGEGGEKIFEEL